MTAPATTPDGLLPPADLVARALERDLGAEDVQLAWELARMAGARPEPERRALAGLVLALLARLHQGSTRLSLAPAALHTALHEVGLSEADLAAAQALAARLQAAHPDEGLAGVVGPDGAYKPLLLVDGTLHPQRLRVLEGRIAGQLVARRAGVTARWTEDQVEEALRGIQQGVTLNTEQTEAVRAAVRRQLAVITGGPGTGKTFIVLSILRVLMRLDATLLDRIALAAPTGKAADRMRASIRAALQGLGSAHPADRLLAERLPQPLTLHRLLGYSPASESFRHHRNHPLPADLILVDEASMIDLHLADRLTQALRPDASLVLLGDADQLPSVDAGAVFADLCRVAGPLDSVRLVQSRRMDPTDPAGKAIFELAQAVNAGASLDRVPPGPVPVAGAAEVPFRGVSLLEASARGLEGFLERWFADRVAGAPAGAAGAWSRQLRRTWRLDDGIVHPDDAPAVARLLEAHERSRVLCVTRVEPVWGADDVNRALHRRLARTLRQAAADGHFLPGEPVMVTRNDYAHGLFNGDAGLVLWVAAGGGTPHKAAVFRRDEQLVAFPVEALRGRLEPAWAITVHKAQGSEYEHVALILPEHDGPLLTREIVYTAVTRARRSVSLVGRRDRLAEAVARRVVRDTGLGERLASPPFAPLGIDH